MSHTWVFLTDTEPGPSDKSDLSAPARAVVECADTVTARTWFTAANSLSLALAVSAAAEQAAQLLESSIEIANRLAASRPDDIEFGVEACLNRIDLLRRENEGEAEAAHRACYDLVLGHPVKKRLMFGLGLRALDSASAVVVRRSLSIIRHRSHVGLLKLYLADGGPVRAAHFAREVISDFPISVAAGMLQSAEVLAAVDPDAPFLQRFDLREPKTEGDFVVLLRALGTQAAFRARTRFADAGRFGSAVARFKAGNTLRNPRTLLLWYVFHSVATERDPDELTALLLTALDVCRRDGDRQLYRCVVELAGGRVSAPPLTVETNMADQDPRQLVAEFSAIGEALAENESNT